jgi:cardiolipin synthase A/B
MRVGAAIMVQMRVLRLLPMLLVFVVTACVVDPPPPRPIGPVPGDAPPTSETISGATDVTLWVFPDDDEQLLIDQIDRAQRRVWMKMYLLTDFRIPNALKDAADRGVDVRVMLEERPFGQSTAAKNAIERLNQLGLTFKAASPVFRLTHEKSFVIDDQVVILTANMTRSSFTRNREFAVLHTQRADVAEVAGAFEADWQRTAFDPVSPRLVWSPINARERINAVINSATQTLDIYAASTLDDQQIGLMAEAQRRGVSVRVLTSPPRSNDGENPAEQDLNVLQRARVKVRLLKSPYVHAKVFVADGRLAFVGSVNISTQSLDFNRELGLLVSDPAAIGRIEQTFALDWAKGEDR